MLTKRSTPREIQEAWADRLESGKDRQGKGRLAGLDGSETAFCCLGVLCDMAEEAGVVGSKGFESDGSCLPMRRYGAVNEGYGLPEEVRNWAGFVTGSPMARVDTAMSLDNGDGHPVRHTHYAELNDHHELTFPEIAKVVRANLPEEG